jgi:regulator of nucleoside diphosphate kinase
MSMRNRSSPHLYSVPLSAGNTADRPILGLHDYGRLEVATYEQFDMQSPMRSRIAKLLSDAHVIPTGEIPPNVITLGSTVRYRVDNDRTERRMLTIGRENVPHNGQYVSVLTPVGLALLGRKPGETVVTETFDGLKLSIQIVMLEHQPEAVARAQNAGPDDDGGPEAA